MALFFITRGPLWCTQADFAASEEGRGWGGLSASKMGAFPENSRNRVTPPMCLGF